MTAFRRTAALLGLILVAATVSPCTAKPTREQIVALSERCKAEQTRMDVVAEFGTDFTGLDLSAVDFRGCHHAYKETILRKADFSNCNLQSADFGAAILDGADFTGADLSGASFVTGSLKDATLLRVNFRSTRIYQTDLSGAKLAHADLSAAEITGSNFGGADLSDAILSGARNEYWWQDFGRADLTRADLSGLELEGARFQGAVLRSADLSGTRLTQADFTGADLTGASFAGAHVEAAAFRDARGLDDAERTRLEGLARRWRFELETATAATLKALYFPGYVLVVLALAALSFRVLRRPDRPRTVFVSAGVNALASVPALTLLGMGLLGAAPTAQFNAGSAGAMELWSTWCQLWPIFMLMLFGCLAVSVITPVVLFASSLWWGEWKRSAWPLAYAALTVVHCLFALNWVGNNFPDA